MKKIDLVGRSSSLDQSHTSLNNAGRNFIAESSKAKVIRNDQPNANFHQMRRVNEDGCHQLESQFEEKDATGKLKLMENRVKRLMFEEERARKLQS